MKGKYKAAIALLLLFILLPLTLLLTLAYWVPTLAGIWLPAGTRIVFEESPRFTRHSLQIPDLHYLIEDCPVALVKNAQLTHPSRWKLDIGSLDINTSCLAKLPETEPSLVRRQRWPNGNPCCRKRGLTLTVSPSRHGKSGKEKSRWRYPKRIRISTMTATGLL